MKKDILKRKKLLLVNWGTQDKVYPFQVAKKMGLVLYLATTAKYPNWVKNFVDEKNIIITNPYDSEKLITDVFNYMENSRVSFDGVTTFFEMSIIPTADLASVLSLPFLSSEAARRSSGNKLVMRIISKKAGINTPDFFSFTSYHEGMEKSGVLKYPAVIKPIRSGHGFGAIKIEKKEDFVECFLLAKNQRNHIYDEWMDYYDLYKNDWIVEQYIPGKVISVDGLVQNNKLFIIGTTEFFMGKEPFLVQEGECIPARISFSLEKRARNLVSRLIKILGFDNCGFHCELRLTKKETYLLEIAGRPPGGNILEEYHLSTGINFAEKYISIALGEKIKIKKNKKDKHVFIKSIIPSDSGILKEIYGLDYLSTYKNLTVQVHKNKGSVINRIYGLSDSIITVKGSCNKEKYMNEILRTIESKIKIDIDSSFVNRILSKITN